jgi:hypothetical protein
MRFVVFMLPAGYQPKNGKPGATIKLDPVMMAKMGRFNDTLRKAGALGEVDGLLPLTLGARLAFKRGKPTVTKGRSIKAKEVVGGYWMIKAKSKEQVVKWMKRCPAEDGDVIEIRQIAEMSDFPEDFQRAVRSS